MYLYVVFVTEIKSGKPYKVEITPIEPQDLKAIAKREFFFNWKLESDFEIYKINIVDQSKILGLVSIERIPEEWRIHIRLLSVSIENKSKKKLFERIVGNLLTHISKLAIKEFGELACVSLKPKGAIAQHYIDTYGMNITGTTLSLELTEILNLIETFDNEN